MNRTIRYVAAVVAAVAVASSASAHNYCEHGNITLGLGLPSPVFALVEQLAPGSVPNGLFYYSFPTEGGRLFTLTGDDGESPLVVGDADSCPGASDDMWVLCAYAADFDIRFSCDGYENGPGDEAGTVPCDGTGTAMPAIWAFAKDAPIEAHIETGSELGEGFSYCEY